MHQAHSDAAPIRHLINKARHMAPIYDDPYGSFRIAVVGLVDAIAWAVVAVAGRSAGVGQLAKVAKLVRGVVVEVRTSANAIKLAPR